MLNMKFQPFPAIETGNLNLVMIDDHHAEKILLIKRAHHLRPQRLHATTLKLIHIHAQIMSNRDELKYNRSISWAVEHKSDKNLIGTIGFKRIDRDHHKAELNFLFEPTEQSKTFAIEAMQAVLAYGFGIIGLNSIHISFDPINPECSKLATSNGFQLDGRLRQSYFDGESYLDCEIYSLLKSGWLSTPGKPSLSAT